MFVFIDDVLDIYCAYERKWLAGDFNAQEGEKLLDTILYQNDLCDHNKDPILQKSKQFMNLF